MQQKQTQKPKEAEKYIKTQKRLLVIAAAVVLLCGLALWGVLELLGSFGGDGTENKESAAYQAEDLGAYLAEEWPSYPFLRYDDGIVTVRGEAKITYEQAKKYGAASYDADLLSTYVSTAQGIAAGLAADCGLTDTAVVLEQYSSDGEVIFTACSDGTVETCWDE